MLCPKCGYITFDELPSCPKCKNDWADVAGKISGIGSMVDAPSFLASVTPGQEIDDMSVVSGAKNTVAVDEGQDSGSTELPSNDGGLDLVLDELPGLEVKETDVEVPEVTIPPGSNDLSGEEEVSGIEIELDDNSEDSPGIQLNADLDLTMDDESLSLPPALELDENDAKKDSLAVDLNDIDLSDLMESAMPEVRHDIPAEQGDDARGAVLDLPSSSSGQGVPVPDLLGIDLSLEDDGDGLDLSLEPETSPAHSAKKETESAIPDLGLSLDLDD